MTKENTSGYQEVNIVGFEVLPDRSIVMKVQSKDGSVFLHRFLKNSPTFFEKTIYHDWPVLVASGGIMMLPSQQVANKSPTEACGQALDNLLSLGQKIVSDENLEDQGLTVSKESLDSKKKTPKRKKPKK